MPVRPGQKLQISATTWNKVETLVNGGPVHLTSSGTLSEPFANSQTRILIRNDSGGTLKQFSIVGLDSPVILSEDNPGVMNELPCLSGVETVAVTHARKFAVLQEPAGDGTPSPIVRAVISGVTWARVRIGSAGVAFAKVVDGFPYLETATSGGAEIIWCNQAADPDEDNTIPALIRIVGAGVDPSGTAGGALDPFNCSRFDCVEGGTVPSEEYNVPCTNVPEKYVVSFGSLTCCDASAAGGEHTLTYNGGTKWLGEEFDCGGTMRRWVLEFTADDQPKLYLQHTGEEEPDLPAEWKEFTWNGVNWGYSGTVGCGASDPLDHPPGNIGDKIYTDCDDNILSTVGGGTLQYNLPAGRVWCCECCNLMEVQGCGPNYTCTDIPTFVCVCPDEAALNTTCPDEYPDGLAEAFVIADVEYVTADDGMGACEPGTVGPDAEDYCHGFTEQIVDLSLTDCVATWTYTASSECFNTIVTIEYDGGLSKWKLSASYENSCVGVGLHEFVYLSDDFSTATGGTFEYDAGESTTDTPPNETTINVYPAA